MKYILLILLIAAVLALVILALRGQAWQQRDGTLGSAIYNPTSVD